MEPRKLWVHDTHFCPTIPAKTTTTERSKRIFEYENKGNYVPYWTTRPTPVVKAATTELHNIIHKHENKVTRPVARVKVETITTASTITQNSVSTAPSRALNYPKDFSITSTAYIEPNKRIFKYNTSTTVSPRVKTMATR